jgi:ATP-dependent Clp protease ATP-binding subunit ClpA
MAIQKEILAPLSLILEGKFREGQTIRVEQRDGSLAFEAA